MNKIINKHMFFISKGLNWSDMPEERKFKRVRDYVLAPTLADNKRQEFARALHNFRLSEGRDPNHNELLELAIGVTIN